MLSVSDDDLGRITIVKHQIDIGDATPVRQPPRRLPFHQRELKQFLGLASYYRRFVRGFTKIASPLHRLSEKNKPWAWTDKCEQAFNLLKHHLVSAPILKLPIFSQNFILDVNASQNGLGAVLSQEVDGHEQVVAYL